MSIANELITRGWYQGGYQAEDGRVCIAGAAKYAVEVQPEMGRNSVQYDEWRAAVDVIRSLVGQNVGYWNDAPERTFDEVLRVAKEADEILGAS